MFEQVGEIEAKVQKILDLCLERRTHTSDEPGADPARNSPVQRPDSLALPLKPILVLDRGHDVATTESDDHLAEQQEQQQQQHQPSPVKKRVTLCQQWRATFFLFGLLVMCVCVCVLFFFFVHSAHAPHLPVPPSFSSLLFCTQGRNSIKLFYRCLSNRFISPSRVGACAGVRRSISSEKLRCWRAPSRPGRALYIYIPSTSPPIPPPSCPPRIARLSRDR